MVIVRVDFGRTPQGGMGPRFLSKDKAKPGWTPKERDGRRFRTEQEARDFMAQFNPRLATDKKTRYITLGKAKVK